MSRDSGLVLHASNRLEILAGELAQLVRTRPLPPLESEIVVVQSQGMARWLALRLAEQLGIAANLACPFPNAFLEDVFGQITPEWSPADDREVNTWRLMEMLGSLDGLPALASLKAYLADGLEVKRFQLARQLADLFDQYTIYRPDLVLAWEQGLEGDWQAELWRRLYNSHAQPHRATLLMQCLAKLFAPDFTPGGLPSRVAIFGVSSLPPYHLQVFAALARHIEVHVFSLNPCREYWGDIISPRELARLGQRKGEAGLLYQEEGNSLLASMGHLGRDFFTQLQELECLERDQFEPPEETSLLATLQSDILELRNPTPGTEKQLQAADKSLQIHSCHSPLRELEVLKDQLLALFEQLPDLKPRDVLVMTPDIEVYSPLIQAVFDEAPEAATRIPYSIADRNYRQEARLAETFMGLLSLVGSRFGASQVLGLLEEEAVRQRFGLAGGDLEFLEEWVSEVGIRWGIDEDCRRRLDLPPFSEHSWQAGMHRLLLGYAMRGRDQRMFEGLLPYDRVDGDELQVLGRFFDFLETIFTLLPPLEKAVPLRRWSARLVKLIESCFWAGEEQAKEILSLRTTVLALAEQQDSSGFQEPVGIETIRAHLGRTFEARQSGSGFLTGGVTFCAMLPMRAIPARVICLLGLNDSSFPRPTIPVSFDLMARHPRRGDRSRRHDDRYLFLEALLSARERLYLSYVGQSVQDGSRLPSSVLISELLDYVEARFGLPEGLVQEHLVTEHRLQAFDPEYFQNNGRLFSYSGENQKAAAALFGPHIERQPLLTVPLSPPAPEEKRVALEQLCRCFTHPVRFLCEQRLGLRIKEKQVELTDREPFDLEGLERYQLTGGLMDRYLAGRKLEDSFAATRAAGLLPPGIRGEVAYQQVCRDVRHFGRRLTPHALACPLPSLEIDLPVADFRVVGRLTGIREHGLLSYRCATVKPKDQIRLWIYHILLNLAAPLDYPRESILLGRDRLYRFTLLADGRPLLEGVLDLYWRSLQEALPLFPASSLAYAEAVLSGKARREALRAAQRVWQGNPFSRQKPEAEDEYHQLFYRERNPLEEDFALLAMEFFGPLLEHRETVEL